MLVAYNYSNQNFGPLDATQAPTESSPVSDVVSFDLLDDATLIIDMGVMVSYVLSPGGGQAVLELWWNGVFVCNFQCSMAINTYAQSLTFTVPATWSVSESAHAGSHTLQLCARQLSGKASFSSPYFKVTLASGKVSSG
jgi:hypothetical protein